MFEVRGGDDDTQRLLEGWLRTCEATLIGPQPRAGIKRGAVSAVKRLLARFGDDYPSGEDDRVLAGLDQQ